MKLKKGDQVIVIAGKDKGKKGKIEKIFPKLNKVLIPGVNLYKKHFKPQGENKPGGIIDVAKPLSVANVALLCPKCSQRTRVGYRVSKNPPGGRASKERICKKCQAII